MSDIKTLFSVVIPTHNRANVIGHAVSSVLNQTFSNFEIIIVDDGSTVDTYKVVHGLDDRRVSYHYRQHQGVSSTRNFGASVSNGRYLAFLDSDDEALPGWLEHLSASLASGGAAVACCGVIKETDKGGEKRSETLLPCDLGPLMYGYHGMYLAGTFAISRDVFESVGRYAEQLRFAENNELFYRVTEYCKGNGLAIATVMQPLIRYIRASDEQRYKDTNDYEKRMDAALYMIEHYGKRLSTQPRVLANMYSIAGVNAWCLGRRKKARECLRSAIVTQRHRPLHYLRLLASVVPPLGKWVWSRH